VVGLRRQLVADPDRNRAETEAGLAAIIAEPQAFGGDYVIFLALSDARSRLLRGRLGYRGELRATGAVLRDQLPFLLRCGFDSFESEQPGFGVALARARTLFSVVYQGAADNRATVALLRLRRHSQPETLAAD